MKPVVAHVLGRYLPRTQTFVYSTLCGLERVTASVFTEQTENLQQFPYEDVTLIPRIGALLRAADKASSIVGLGRPIKERRWAKALADRKAAVIHGHFGWSAPRTVPLQRRLGLPLVTTFYGMDMSQLPRKPEWRAHYAELFETGTVFLVEGGHMAAALVDLGCPFEKVVVHRIGIDLAVAPAAPPARLRQPGEPVRILMCSSFVEKKGVTYGVKAFAQVHAEYPDTKLVLVGDGPLARDIGGEIHDGGVIDAVERYGFVTHEQLSQILSTVDIFMAPSVTASNGDTEGGAPTILLEAQAAGLPIVSTKHADIPEVVHQDAGILVPERDVDALSEALSRLLDRPHEWHNMGAVGRRNVEEHHDITRLSRDLEDLYMSLLT